jgi:hypothetical protein
MVSTFSCLGIYPHGLVMEYHFFGFLKQWKEIHCKKKKKGKVKLGREPTHNTHHQNTYDQLIPPNFLVILGA